MDALVAFFDQSGFMPHGMCYLWIPSLLWLHVGSDLLIAAAYISIPVTLFRIMRARSDLPFDSLFLLFALFIIACGATHLLAIWDVWQADYWISGSVKAFTAVISVTTAIALIRLMPQALALPSPAMLRAKNEELEREISEHENTQRELERTLKAKSTLLQEVHHRVKNNLQIISSLMRIQSRHINDQQSLDTLRESENRIRSMALLHENLYQDDSPGTVSISDYVTRLVDEILASFGELDEHVRVQTRIDDLDLGLDTAVPLGLIVCELLSNSLKHAFAPGQTGEIFVSLVGVDGRVELLVSDTGLGMPDGVDATRPETMGLQLVESLARQIGADYNPPGPGSSRFGFIF